MPAKVNIITIVIYSGRLEPGGKVDYDISIKLTTKIAVTPKAILVVIEACYYQRIRSMVVCKKIIDGSAFRNIFTERLRWY